MTHFSRLFTAVSDVPPADHDRELAFASGEPDDGGADQPFGAPDLGLG
jgi:hypothetical protein